MQKQWSLLLFSSIVYALPFVSSIQYWPVVFLFPVPLFFCLLTQRCGFKAGLLWGSASVGLHLAGVFYSIMHMAQGSLMHKIVPWVGGTLYFGVYIGIWFWLTTYIISKIKRYIPYIWLASIWLLFVSFDYGCLSVFNRVEGLFLLNPLLPLAECVPLLRLMAYITKPGLLLLFFVIPWAGVLGYLTKKWRWYCMSAIGIIVWVGTCFLPARFTEVPPWLSHIGFITESFYEVSGNQLENAPLLGVAVKERVTRLLKKQPQVELIVLPESSLVECPLAECEKALAYWTHEKLGKKVTLVVGAFRRDHKGLHNALHVIRDGHIVDVFEKRHAMLLTEHIAPWWDFGFLHDLYFKDWGLLTVSTNERKPLPLLPEQSFVPYICSELFFNPFPDDTYREPILVVCNDIWVKAPYIRRLMVLESRLKAVQWQRFILYVSFFYAAYMTPS